MLWLLKPRPQLFRIYLACQNTLEKIVTVALTDGSRVSERERTNWSASDQLKLHLDKTALDVFCTLPASDIESVESAIEALRKRFKPRDIEELWGMTQGSDTIEQLGISIQQASNNWDAKHSQVLQVKISID